MSGKDGLHPGRAIPERMLPSLVAAMAFLAALALAEAEAAHLLALRWSMGAGALLSVQVPDPDGGSAASGMTRMKAVLAQLARTPGVTAIHPLDAADLRRLLQPWLGGDTGEVDGQGGGIGDTGQPLPLPGVVQLRLTGDADIVAPLARSLAEIAPGTLVEDSAVWRDRLLALTTSLQACAGIALLTVAAVAGCVVALATRAGIATRRQAIEIVHGLGASDGYIAGRFAGRAAGLAAIGGAAGALLALPLLDSLSHLAAPFGLGQVTGDGAPPDFGASAHRLGVAALLPDQLPAALLVALPALPVAAGLIGWLTAQGTVRVWLRRLP